MLHVLVLLLCAVVIYLACEWFVNAVEWLGARLQVGGLAVGSLLAAAGTALPESVVTLVAVLFGSRESGDDIAVGAALGGPLVVGTIAYGVAGLTLGIARRRGYVPADVDQPRLARDQTWFLVVFAAKVALGVVAFAIKPWLGLVFFAVYAVYFWRELRDGGGADGGTASPEDLEPLRLQPGRERPSTWAVVAQTVVTLATIFVASQLFVRQLEWAGPALGLPAVVVALLLAPVATELPEVLNAVIWVRQGKTRLALANLSGSMMIQATVPTGIGLLGTAWHFDTPLLLAAGATALSVLYLRTVFVRRRATARGLALAVLPYGAFALALALT